VPPIVTAHRTTCRISSSPTLGRRDHCGGCGRQSGLSLALLAKLMHRHKLGDANGAGIVLRPCR
jgi:hypothetical protein